MGAEVQPGSILRFGAFELVLNGGEIRKSGVLLKLRPQAFRVLVLLASRAGQVVSRQQLRQEVWGDSTVVDFEQGLNFCIRQIRVVLADDADRPRFIETIPRRGYRFLPPVTSNALPPPPAVAAAPPVIGPQRVLTRRLAVAGLAVIGSVLGWQYWPAADAPVPARRHSIPLTSYPGFERDPALSPDGNHVAFAWDGEKQDNFDIYTTSLRSGAPVRLTSHPAEDGHPAYSPDGRTIAFFRRVGYRLSEVLLASTVGNGPERKLAEIGCEFQSSLCSLAWSPDGQWLAVPHRESAESPTSLYLLSALTGDRRRLTTGGAGRDHGDLSPAFSPDGRTLAFTRRQGFAAGEIYLLPLTEDFHAGGEPRRLTNRHGWAISPMWADDGRHIVYLFAQGHETPYDLQTIAVSGATASVRSMPLADNIVGFTLKRHLVYGRVTHDTNIWRAEIRPPGAPLSTPKVLISSTRRDGLARYSPDGKRIAFASTRSGSWEVWVAEAADGSNARQLTHFGGPHVAVMGWSPDGEQLVFHGFRSFPEARLDLFTLASAGGTPRRLTGDSFEGFTPVYSRDGRWMYFSSRRSGRTEIWKIPAGREERLGEAIQITDGDGGSQPAESPDGKTLYYCHASLGKGVWKVPAEGGKAMQVTGPSAKEGCGLAVTAEGLYYIPAPVRGAQHSIDFVAFSNGRSRPVVLSDRPFEMSLSLSPDQRFILYTQTDQSDSDLMLIENFQAP